MLPSAVYVNAPSIFRQKVIEPPPRKDPLTPKGWPGAKWLAILQIGTKTLDKIPVPTAGLPNKNACLSSFRPRPGNDTIFGDDKLASVQALSFQPNISTQYPKPGIAYQYIGRHIEVATK
ncbi:hypothetical protein DRQ50_13500 [bacterium]|nr:MAG: hypothetical protein DRQ50_13500 [bacterium]